MEMLGEQLRAAPCLAGHGSALFVPSASSLKFHGKTQQGPLEKGLSINGQGNAGVQG